MRVKFYIFDICFPAPGCIILSIRSLLKWISAPPLPGTSLISGTVDLSQKYKMQNKLEHLLCWWRFSSPSFGKYLHEFAVTTQVKKIMDSFIFLDHSLQFWTTSKPASTRKDQEISFSVLRNKEHQQCTRAVFLLINLRDTTRRLLNV